MSARSAVPLESDYANAVALLAEAMVSASGSDPGGAWNSFAEAMRIMESQQLWLFLGEAHVLHARALATAGLLEQARDALRQARALFSRLGADAKVVDTDRVHRRLSPEVTKPA